MRPTTPRGILSINYLTSRADIAVSGEQGVPVEMVAAESAHVEDGGWPKLASRLPVATAASTCCSMTAHGWPVSPIAFCLLPSIAVRGSERSSCRKVSSHNALRRRVE